MKVQAIAQPLAGAVLTGMLLAAAQVQINTEWPWVLLSVAWIPLLVSLPHRAWACWALASLAHVMMMLPLMTGVAAAVGLSLGLPVMGVVAGISALPFALYPWWARRWGVCLAHLFVLVALVLVDALRVRSVVNWVGLGDALGESTAIAPLLYALGLSGCLLILVGINLLWLWGGKANTWTQRSSYGVLAACLSGWPLLWLVAESEPDSSRSAQPESYTWRVALVAPTIGADEADGDPLKVERLMAAYQQLSAEEVDVVLMPQSSLNGLSPSEPLLRQELFTTVARQGIALLAGSEQRLPDHDWQRPHQYNAAFLVNPQAAHEALTELATLTPTPHPAAVQWQAKRHPVPWTEYWPEELRHWPLGGLEKRVAPYVPGKRSQTLWLQTKDEHNLELGVMLCYDAYAPDIASELHQQGSDILIVLSSDESFAGSALSRQGLRMARLRGMSLGLPIIRVAWSAAGTGAFDAQGRTLSPQTLQKDVPGVTLWHIPIAEK
jgi:apolipoprotein N-acyltransferase